MARYVIHIGPPKTASKYLQSSLFHLRDALLRDGICYPDDWWAEGGHIMHSPLLDQLTGPLPNPDLEAIFRRLNHAGHATVVLSCEGFAGLPTDRLRYFRDQLGGAEVEIVFYVRRWSDRIPSSWRQTIKMGRHETLPEYYAPLMRDPTKAPNLNYSLVWDRFADVFGRNSLRIVSQTNLAEHKVDLFRHFCTEILGWTGQARVPEAKLVRNISPDAVDTEILRALNAMDFQTTGRTDIRMRVRFLNRRDQLDTAWLAELMKDDVASLVIADNAAPFRAAWSAIAAYADRLVGKEYGARMFSGRANEFRFVRTNYLLKDDAMAELRRLYRQLAPGKPGLQRALAAGA